MKIKITVTDDKGEIYIGETELKRTKKGSISNTSEVQNSTGLKKGSIADNLNQLIDEGYFDYNHTIRDMIDELKSKDVHYNPSDLTRPLRTLVRGGRLKKTKTLPDGTKSGKWTYIKNG